MLCCAVLRCAVLCYEVFFFSTLRFLDHRKSRKSGRFRNFRDKAGDVWISAVRDDIPQG